MMDWTGGTRRRYTLKDKQNAVVRKQKEHFAKVRAAQHEQLDLHEHQPEAFASKQYRHTMLSSQSPKSRRPTSSRASKSSIRPSIHGPRHHSLHTLQASRMPRSDKASRSKANMSEEDRLLLANRERFLARSDWLGLAASRPARIAFPTSSDRDHSGVGKRRKVYKSRLKHHEAQPARRRSITPLYEHRLPAFEPTMSGVIRDEDIEVKVGTDAFVSQSQYSHPAQPSINTSMRQPSTEFGPLSEESMLMGVDDDGFEIGANGEYLGALGRAETIEYGFQRKQHSPFADSTNDLTMPMHSIAPTFATTNHGQVGHNDSDYPPYVRDGSDHRLNGVMRSDTSNQLHEQTLEDNMADVVAFDQESAQSGKETPVSSSEIDPEEDERLWRRAMRIPEASLPGKSSLAALKSSSPHVTQSTASAWPVSVGHEGNNRDLRLGYGTEPKFPRQHQPFGIDNRHPTLGQPPSASQPKDALKEDIEPHQEEANNEAVWRDFILGKRANDSDSSDQEREAWVAEQGERLQRAFQSTLSRIGTEQGRSDRVTVGDSVFAPERISDEESGDSDRGHNIRRQGFANTSMVGHATTANFEDDKIDEVFPDDSVSRAVENIHATHKTSVLNPERFKWQETQRSSPMALEPRRFQIR